DFRQGMGGVGGFSTINHTLYVGRITNPKDENLRGHFGKWGELDCAHVFRNRGVAFATYKIRWHVEFAKEAMMHQSLHIKEVVKVRYST
ncbi:hypothetical protein DM01DRAFT_233100, partial [Hesseltinella vesiculosa]